ncbi:MAG: hypothetical protein ACD_41C00163G0005 [uncultured bacterium]|nr:MAG: hypothetical protein ACD_41C00163G0005 [uncultured bacterium]
MKNRLVLASLLLIALTGLDTDTQDSAIATNLGLYGGQAADFALDPLSDTAYMTTFSPNGLFASADLGGSWSGLPSEVNYGNGKSVEVDPDSGTTFALVGDSLLRTTDQGTTWEDISTNLEATIGNVLVSAHGRLLIGIANGQVAVSTDSGETFDLFTVSEGNDISYLTASPDTDVFYVIVDQGALWQSTDGGETWTDLEVTNNGMTEGTSLWKVAVNPTDGDNLATTSGVSTSTNYITTDGGDNWTGIDNGSGLAFDTTGRLYVGFMYTDNPTAGSPTWTNYDSSTPLSSIYADLIAVDPEDEQVIFNNSSMGPAKSDDRAASWTDIVDGVVSVKVYDISQTTDKVTVWLGANGGLAKTENFDDDEPTWEYPILPAGSTNTVHAVWVNPDDANVVVSGSGGENLAYSSDGGDTWSMASAPEFLGNVYEILQSRIDDNTLYAAIGYYDLTGDDSGAVFMSTDVGQTWTDLGFTNDFPATAMSIASDDTLYVAADGDVSAPGIYTYDGSSWSEVSGDISGQSVTSVLVHPDNDDVLLVTTTEGLWKSTDGGSTWTEIIIADANNLDTLTPQTTTSPITLYVTGQDTGSLNGTVYKSSDGGDTWGEWYEGLKQESFYAMFFDGLMAGNDRGIYDIKSRAKLKLTEKNQKNVSVSLRDAATAKRLKHKTIKLYRKKSGEWKKIDAVRTNTKGKATVRVNVTDGTKLKATWKPSAKDRREYAKATSKVLRFGGV